MYIAKYHGIVHEFTTDAGYKIAVCIANVFPQCLSTIIVILANMYFIIIALSKYNG